MEYSQRKKAKLVERLRALNEQFAEWIQDQLVNHRDDVWLDGVEDYIGHAKSLLVEAADSDSPVSGLKDSPSQAGTAFDGPLSASGAAAGPPSFSPPVKSLPSQPASTSAASALPSLSLFGAPQTTVSAGAGSWGNASSSPGLTSASLITPSSGLFRVPPSTAASTSAGAAPAKPFSFGANPFISASSGLAASQPSMQAFSLPPASTPAFGEGAPAPNGLPSFGTQQGSSSNGTSQPLAFSWGANTGAGRATEASEEANGELEEDEGPKAELKLGEDTTLLFKEPAKLYFKGKDGVGWDDRGKGTLTVRQSKAEEDQSAGSANIVFTMESGKVIVNGAVYKGLRAQKLKNPKMVCMNLTLALDNTTETPDTKPQTVMFSIGNIEKAERFCAVVHDAIPE